MNHLYAMRGLTEPVLHLAPAAPAVPRSIGKSIMTTPNYTNSGRTDVTKTWEAHGWERPNRSRQERIRLELNRLSD